MKSAFKKKRLYVGSIEYSQAENLLFKNKQSVAWHNRESDANVQLLILFHKMIWKRAERKLQKYLLLLLLFCFKP